MAHNPAIKPRSMQHERVPLTVRVPHKILKQIDEKIEGHEFPISRNHWIIEAILDKLRGPASEEKNNGQK